jgi:hypothetical protein
MPEIRWTDQPDELETARDNLAPRPRALNRPDWCIGLEDGEALLQSPLARAILPISCDCKERARLARSLPRPRGPSRGSNLFSSSAIGEDMRQPAKRLKYLASERRKSAVPCVAETAQSLFGGTGRLTVSRKNDVQTKT